MSQENDEARLLRCYKKYEQIIKQMTLLDEITESMSPAARSKLTKMMKNSAGNSSGGSSSVASDQANYNQVLVETITKFLNELNPEHVDKDPKPSNYQ